MSWTESHRHCVRGCPQSKSPEISVQTSGPCGPALGRLALRTQSACPTRAAGGPLPPSRHRNRRVGLTQSDPKVTVTRSHRLTDGHSGPTVGCWQWGGCAWGQGLCSLLQSCESETILNTCMYKKSAFSPIGQWGGGGGRGDRARGLLTQVLGRGQADGVQLRGPGKEPQWGRAGPLPSGPACSRWPRRGPCCGPGSTGPARPPPSGPRSPGDSPPGSSCGDRAIKKSRFGVGRPRDTPPGDAAGLGPPVTRNPFAGGCPERGLLETPRVGTGAPLWSTALLENPPVHDSINSNTCSTFLPLPDTKDLKVTSGLFRRGPLRLGPGPWAAWGDTRPAPGARLRLGAAPEAPKAAGGTSSLTTTDG